MKTFRKYRNCLLTDGGGGSADLTWEETSERGCGLTFSAIFNFRVTFLMSFDTFVLTIDLSGKGDWSHVTGTCSVFVCRWWMFFADLCLEWVISCNPQNVSSMERGIKMHGVKNPTFICCSTQAKVKKTRERLFIFGSASIRMPLCLLLLGHRLHLKIKALAASCLLCLCR